MNQIKFWLTITALITTLMAVVVLAGFSFLSAFIFILTTLLLLQGAFATYGMLYGFLNPDGTKSLIDVSKQAQNPTTHKFSLLIPARQEESVIAQTLESFNRLNYPKNAYEVLVIVRVDDPATIAAATSAINKMSNSNFRLITIDGFPINKSKSLNEGIKFAQFDHIGVFDAEDEPHPNILQSVNTAYNQQGVDIVQSAIQLVNVTPLWFAPFNCLEYYFWFKSVLPMFSRLGSTPLGGNTVFFKKHALDAINGWDEAALTEDADIGIRLSQKGFKTAMLYSPNMATLEETPISQDAFIRQRSRWDHGFLQVFFKGEWLNLKSLKQQLLTAYLLLQPLVLHLSILGIVSMPLISLFAKVPIGLALYSFIPFYFLLLQLSIKLVGLLDLKRNFNIEFSNWLYVAFVLNYIPYQFLLSFASFRAIVRYVMKVTNWEKTTHINAHRALNYTNEA